MRTSALRALLSIALGVIILSMGCTSDPALTGAEDGAARPSLACDPPDAPIQLDRLATPWREPEERSRIHSIDVAYQDQDGRRGRVSQLADKPILLTFFYSRCQNAAKCSAAVTRMASLQRLLKQQCLDRDVRLLVITYEPQFDTPERLHRFGGDRGLMFGEDALALRLDEAGHQSFVDEIEAPVNYNAGWVNTHGVELNLIDADGRIVRKYHTVLWDNAAIEVDLRRVLAER